MTRLTGIFSNGGIMGSMILITGFPGFIAHRLVQAIRRSEPDASFLFLVQEKAMAATLKRRFLYIPTPKVISRDYSRTPRLWWYPYTEEGHRFFQTAVIGLHGSGAAKMTSLARLIGFPAFWKQAPVFSILKNFWRLW